MTATPNQTTAKVRTASARLSPTTRLIGGAESAETARRKAVTIIASLAVRACGPANHLHHRSRPESSPTAGVIIPEMLLGRDLDQRLLVTPADQLTSSRQAKGGRQNRTGSSAPCRQRKAS